MRKILIITIIFHFLFSELFAQDKSHLKVVLAEENHPCKNGILRVSGKYSSDSLAIFQLRSKIKKIRNKGYWEANIDSISNLLDTIHAFVHLGRRYTVANLVKDNSDIKAINSLTFQSRKKNGITWDDVLQLEGKVIDDLNNTGYPFAAINIDSLKFNRGQLSGFLNLQKGKYVIWDTIRLKGNLDISLRYLSKYTGVINDAAYSEKAFKDITTKVAQLEFANEIKVPEVEFIKGKAIPYIYLDKAKSNRFDGILGVQSNKGEDDDVTLTGEINLLLNNAFKFGEKLKLNWRKFESKSQDLSIGFIYPYVFLRTGLEFDFSIFKQDTSYLTTNLKLGFRLLQRGNRHVKLFYEYRSSSLISTSHLVSSTVLPDFADMKVHLGGVGVEYSKLDYPFNPKKGWYFDSGFKIGKHSIQKNNKIPDHLYEGIDLDGTIWNLGWLFEMNIPLARKISYRFRNKGGIMDAPNLFINDLFKLGGLNTLRGFDEDAFRASKYIVVTNELRFIPERNTSFYLFFDSAYHKNEIVNTTTDDFPMGVGFGLNFSTGAGIFSLNYALGRQENQNFDFNLAKIHFGFVSQF